MTLHCIELSYYYVYHILGYAIFFSHLEKTFFCITKRLENVVLVSLPPCLKTIKKLILSQIESVMCKINYKLILVNLYLFEEYIN